jgi:hypothetical protein
MFGINTLQIFGKAWFHYPQQSHRFCLANKLKNDGLPINHLTLFLFAYSYHYKCFFGVKLFVIKLFSIKFLME